MTEASSRDAAERPDGEWPRWIDDLLHTGPLAELEREWKAAVGDAIVKVLDQRAEARRSTTTPRSDR